MTAGTTVKVQISLHLDQDLYEALVKYSKRDRKPKAQVIRDCLLAHLREQKLIDTHLADKD